MNEREYSPKEYVAKFRVHSCHNCLSRKVKEFERTKGDMTYRIYVCARCKNVIKREII